MSQVRDAREYQEKRYSRDEGAFALGDDNDFQIHWSVDDVSNPAAVIALGNTSQQLHITDVGAQHTDWARSAGTHPELAIHSNTTPATDYLKIGNHDGTTATIDVVGGTTLDIRISGTGTFSLTSSGISLAVGTVTMADGGTVTQATNKSTGVTLSKNSGQITMNNAALAAAAEVTFTVTNTQVAATDVVVVNHGSAGTAGAYLVGVSTVGAGSFAVTVANLSAGSLSEAIVINFVVLGGASS